MSNRTRNIAGAGPTGRSAIAALACLAALCSSAVAADAPPVRIVNVVDDFLAYHKACANAGPTVRVAKWKEILEDKHPRFFADVIYRKLAGADLARHKQWCLDEFWKNVSPKIPALAKVNAGMADRIRGVLARFRKSFPDFRAETDFYVTVAFSFKGKVDTIRTDGGEKKVFALALEKFTAGGPGLEITIAHEMFHLYHFRTFSTKGALYRTLWAEGLASYAAAVVVPGHKTSTYLGFPGKKVDQCHQLLPALAGDLKKYMGQVDPRRRRLYFGAEANDTKVPPESGYYVGFLLAASLAKQHAVKDLARLPSDTVYKLVAAELDRLATPTR